MVLLKSGKLIGLLLVYKPFEAMGRFLQPLRGEVHVRLLSSLVGKINLRMGKSFINSGKW